jgi:UDP-N-acetylmuramoyl-L-alanyl-D-glutamate--2,6-diaminopimelate ligase
VDIDAAIFTTFGRDHLNFHETRDAYFQAKKRLFEQVADQETVAILNANANRVERLRSACKDYGLPIRTYGTSVQTDAQLFDTNPTDQGLRIRARLYDREVDQELPLFTRPMAENLLAASLVALSSGKSIEDVLVGWESVQTPPGRMERVACHGESEIYIDYAHTPGALESTLRSLAPRSSGRRLLVFGCGGDRDKGKRTEMGRVARRHAERSFVTNDNPRNESPGQIRAQILETCPGAEEIPDRRAAIRRAIEVSSNCDTIIIAGKGHENHQIQDEGQRHFSDREVAQELAD